MTWWFESKPPQNYSAGRDDSVALNAAFRTDYHIAL